MFSRFLYLLMAALQLNEVCLVMILWASVFAFFPMVASCAIYVCISMGLGVLVEYWDFVLAEDL